MVYVKKLVMFGFKSFAKRTEIVFDQGINVILGPNGSGKSNIADALCFVLGRLSVKSMRAAKAKNLIFMGSKFVKPAREAFVEIIFDNKDRAFSIDRDEVGIKRLVRVNGQSLYKINEEPKTRGEIIEMLAQAGIDPYGFNLILQGQIQSIVKMHSEDRRKIIEDVAGIAIYESRKEKALHELEKTDERLKEIGTILRERSAYMKNLEKEKTQAERYKELEMTVKRTKASIIHKKMEDKKKELDAIIKSINEKSEQKSKLSEKRAKLEEISNKMSEKIAQINRQIQQATGIEQENLHNQVVDLKAELGGLKVRKENYENRKNEIERRISEVSKSIPLLEEELEGLRKESPLVAKKAGELKKKKAELSIIEEQRRKSNSLRTELNSLKEVVKEKERQLTRVSTEGENSLKQIEENSVSLESKNEADCIKKLNEIRENIQDRRKRLEELARIEIENIKTVSVCDSEIKRLNEVKSKVEKIDTCPLCQSKITGNHRDHVFKEANEKIDHLNTRMSDAENKLKESKETKGKTSSEINELDKELSKFEKELSKHRIINEKKEYLKKYVAEEKNLKVEINKLEERRKNLEIQVSRTGEIEQNFQNKVLEIEEISSRTEEDVDTSLLYKEREIEGLNNILKQGKRDLEEIEVNIKEMSEKFEEKNSSLEEKEQQEKELNERFKKMFNDRDKTQSEMQGKNFESNEVMGEIRGIEEQVNYLRIGQAKADAEREAMEMEMRDFVGIELMQGSIQALDEKMKKAQESLVIIGSINMRALEVYDEIKKEYDIVQDKVNTLEKEKNEIMKIIEEIDKKKTREFTKTFKAINELFSRNFSKLSTKGNAFLEIQNQEDIFAGGINIVVKLAKGKYFDVTSLSGGEQTLVALSLLFAIQEHKPYHFYIFDEIDAALDKRNSERLAALLNQYMKSGQYIVITHNDTIILNSNLLYGVSMQEGVSKILSLNIKDASINKPQT